MTRPKRDRSHDGHQRQGDKQGVSQDLSTRQSTVRFCLLFLLMVLAFTLLSSTALAQNFVHAPLCRLLVILTAPILGIVGTTQASGTYLSLNGFGVAVVDACDGVLPAYIYLAAVLALPCRRREKLRGVLLGIPIIFLTNLIRLTTLVICGAYWPSVFEQVHIYVWQALVIAISMAVWVFWAERFVQPGLEARRRPVS